MSQLSVKLRTYCAGQGFDLDILDLSTGVSGDLVPLEFHRDELSRYLNRAVEFGAHQFHVVCALCTVIDAVIKQVLSDMPEVKREIYNRHLSVKPGGSDKTLHTMCHCELLTIDISASFYGAYAGQSALIIATHTIINAYVPKIIRINLYIGLPFADKIRDIPQK